jgi:ankyrin repeat protein
MDLNAPDADGATPLAWAAHLDRPELARLLLGAGADPNAANHYGVTPLSLACTNRSERMVEVLLAAGADPNASQANGETPLLIAARTGSARILRQLLLRGADVNAAQLRRQQTALMWAVANAHVDAVRILLEGGADPGAASTSGFTALMFAARQGNAEITRLLIAAGAEIDQAANDGTTALFVAAASLGVSGAGHDKVAALLLEHGASPELQGLPHTALHLAVSTRKAPLVRTLVARGANPNARVARRGQPRSGGEISLTAGATPFWLAAKEVDAEMMRILAAAGADPALTPDDRTTALMTAAGVGQVEGPRARNAFASPYRSRWDESHALEAVVLLVELGADVNAVNASRGWTALHGAAHMGADRMVEWLVARGATLDVPDKNGQTPWSIAAEGARDQLTRIPHQSTADLLRRLGAAGLE